MAHTTHTQKYRNTQIHAHTDRYRYYFLHFTPFGSFGIHAKDTNFIFGIPQTYTCIDNRHAHTYTERLTHRYTTTHACLYTYTNTHIYTQTDVHVGNLRKWLVQIHF